MIDSKAERRVEESPLSFSLRLLAWYDAILRHGLYLRDLPALTVGDLRALHSCRRLLARLGIYQWIEDALSSGDQPPPEADE